MSTTLTNGLKLPDKGSVDWYADMQNNYAILDGAVGTVAEHTSALSEKAPLVHTHTKADITDFPALATVATSGSYNDLSNIPATFAPASHTHGNLTNDGKIGTTANKPLITGTDGVVQAGSFGNTANTFCEGNDSRLSDARTPVAHTHTKSDVTDLFNSANTWTGQNTFKTTVTYDGNFACYWKRTNLTVGTLPSTTMYYGATRCADSEGTTITLTRGLVDTSGKNYFRQYTYAFSNTSKFCSMGSGIDADGSNSYFAFNAENVIPNDNNTTNLGTSTNRWKTLNGINPGALSLPNQDVGSINLSGNITVLDGSASNDLTQTVNGWLFIYIENTTGAYIRCYVGSGSGTRAIIRGVVDAEQSQIYVFVPIYANITVSLYVKATSISRARFYPCLGNV